MKFTSTQENLNSGLAAVSNLAGRSVGLPILNNILLETINGVLVLSATNLEIGIKTEVRGKVEQEGRFTVSAKIFSDYVNILPADNVALEVKDSQLIIKCGNFKTKIRGQDAEEFPIIPVLEENNALEIESNVLKEALSQTTFATSFDEMRPEIGGVLFNISQKMLLLVATDSYRLARKQIQLSSSSSDKQIIIPLKALQEVERVLGSMSEKVDLYFNENQVMFKLKPTLIVSRLIEGNFPDYKQIIPKDFSTQVKINKEDLVQATRAAALFSRTGINDINLRFSKDKVEVKTTNSQLGEQQAVLDTQTQGEDVSVTFNYKYLLDGLQAAPGEDVLMELNSGNSPAVLRDEKDESFLYLIMPIKQ